MKRFTLRASNGYGREVFASVIVNDLGKTLISFWDPTNPHDWDTPVGILTSANEVLDLLEEKRAKWSTTSNEQFNDHCKREK